MTHIEMENIIAEIVADKLSVDRGLVVPSAKLREELGADSMAALEVAFELEERFNIDIPESDIQAVRTVDDLIHCIAAKTGVGVPHEQDAVR